MTVTGLRAGTRSEADGAARSSARAGTPEQREAESFGFTTPLVRRARLELTLLRLCLRVRQRHSLPG